MWFELLLALAVMALIFELVPTLPEPLIRAADPRRWPRGVWLGLNGAAIIALGCLRFRNQIKSAAKRVRPEFSGHRSSAQSSGSEADADYEARVNRDAEWRERAKKRLPFT